MNLDPFFIHQLKIYFIAFVVVEIIITLILGFRMNYFKAQRDIMIQLVDSYKTDLTICEAGLKVKNFTLLP